MSYVVNVANYRRGVVLLPRADQVYGLQKITPHLRVVEIFLKRSNVSFSNAETWVSPVSWWRLWADPPSVSAWSIAWSPEEPILWSTSEPWGESETLWIVEVLLVSWEPVEEGCSCRSRGTWRWWSSWCWWRSPGWTGSRPAPRPRPGPGATSGWSPGRPGPPLSQHPRNRYPFALLLILVKIQL